MEPNHIPLPDSPPMRALSAEHFLHVLAEQNERQRQATELLQQQLQEQQRQTADALVMMAQTLSQGFAGRTPSPTDPPLRRAPPSLPEKFGRSRDGKLEAWLTLCEQHFECYGATPNQKVYLVVAALEGFAKDWVDSRQNERGPFASYEELVSELRQIVPGTSPLTDSQHAPGQPRRGGIPMRIQQLFI